MIEIIYCINIFDQIILIGIFILFWDFIITKIRKHLYLQFKNELWFKRIAHVKNYIGLSAQDEVLLNFSYAVHHTFGVLLMFIGYYFSYPVIYRYGVIQEASFCLLDMTNIIIKRYPYTNFNIGLALLIFAHHVPSLSYLYLNKHYSDNIYFQKIGLSLLFSGCVTLWIIGFQYRFNIKANNDMIKLIFIHTLNFLVFFYCRFIIVTINFIKLFMIADYQHKILFLLCGSSFTIFHILGLPLLYEKIIKLYKRLY